MAFSYFLETFINRMKCVPEVGRLASGMVYSNVLGHAACQLTAQQLVVWTCYSLAVCHVTALRPLQPAVFLLPLPCVRQATP